MIEPRLASFAMGATFGMLLCGWPWHPRFSRYSRMQDPDWRRSFSHENTNPPSGDPPLVLRRRGSNPPAPDRKPPPPAGPPIYGWGPRQLNPPPPAPGMRRIYYDMPATMAECGGPCFEAWNPRACTCGALWRDVPIKPNSHSFPGVVS